MTITTGHERTHTEQEIKEQKESDLKTLENLKRLLKESPNIRTKKRNKAIKQIEERQKDNYKAFSKIKFIEVYF